MSQAYGKTFAYVYNKKWSEFIEKIGPFILDFYSNKPISKKNKKILDLCCGTGQLASLFLEKGHYVTGIDLSGNMLYHAEENNKKYIKQSKAEFIQDNAANFTLKEKYGLVVSTYDSLNHLEDEKSLKNCFDSAYKVLVKDGYFIFDLNTYSGLQKWKKAHFIKDDEMMIKIKGGFNKLENKAYTHISGFVRQKDGTSEWFTEVIFNTCFKMETVKELLNKAKFKEIYFAKADDLSKPIENPEKENRVFIIAKNNSLDKNKRTVEVVPYNPNWEQNFKDEAKKIKKIFEEICVDIHHIGSTAIPLVKAKPIIDIMAEVKDINKVDNCNKQMEELGYKALGEYGIPKRRFFQKGGNNRTHYVHIFQTGNKEIKRHIAFRDYLISHPEKAKEYSSLKEKLEKKYRYDIDKYQEGKDKFIKKIDKLLGNQKSKT